MKILLGGDSWGCGVWKVQPTGLAIGHKGIEQFMLDDGHEVINVSKGGISNKNIIECMKLLPNLDFDHIFVIETSPLRDTDYLKPFANYEHLIELNGSKRFEFYSLLEALNKPIYLLGGCSKVDTEIVKDFKNLHVVIPSIPEFLSTGFIAPDIYVDHWIHQYKKWDLETIDKLSEQSEIWFRLNKKCEYFREDAHHPDIRGHEKVYNYIKENILT